MANFILILIQQLERKLRSDDQLWLLAMTL